MSEQAKPPCPCKTPVGEMPQIADGDIVEVVLRGEVRDINRHGFTVGSTPYANRVIRQAGHVVSVTKVEPEWRPRDIVLSPAGFAYARISGDRWIAHGSETAIPHERMPSPLTLLVRDGEVVSS